MTTSILRFHNELEIAQAVETSRQTFRSGHTRPLKFRRHQLEQLWRLLDDNTDQICEALYKDLRKHKNECILGELVPSKEEINDALEHLEEWAKDVKVTPALVNRVGVTCLKRKEPKGSVLIISPWNYPIFLTVGPLVGAIAAGCTAVIKPSEVAPHTAKIMTELFPRYLDSRAYIVINGAAHETTKLLESKWDHIFYTGNGMVAKIIMKAAAQHLTSLTLELGGKSPVIIDENANMAVAAKRIAFGKTFNAGQTCVAPDYILVTAKAEEKFVAALKKAMQDLLGSNPQSSTDYGRIINNRHFHRLSKVLSENQSGEIVIGGQTDEKDLYIAPTVVANVDRDDKLMEDEIFGPLLPMIRVADIDDAIEFINSRDDPLALYVFSSNKKLINKVMDSTRSGGILVNDTLMHVAEGNLPFGGTGPSGMGSYHGVESFNCFTHERSTMIKDLNPVSEAAMAVRYAPYTSTNLKIARIALESVPRFKKNFILKHFKWIVFAIIFGVGFKRFA
ncbi:Aldehyde dehydrogenase [Mortierella antarctica]|nr:Aldehyde dehydrogenase [Mortierella alpina]KAF9989638.1 Aldehyde dehydrogenase [Mortierella antarctica]